MRALYSSTSFINVLRYNIVLLGTAIICAEHHYTQTNTNNVNKTYALLQKTGSKDKPKVVFMQKS
jgi:hypothetical protein